MVAVLGAFVSLIPLGVGIYRTVSWDDNAPGLLLIGIGVIGVLLMWAWARTMRRIRRRIAEREHR
jgi:hypothetical protein